MYVKRVQIQNYGPIGALDIKFPFDDGKPKPVLLVGENGSGKSILLSHIVNGLVGAKGVSYPDTPEVDTDKVFKLRAPSYIKSGKEFFTGRVDYESNLFVEELMTRRIKQEYQSMPEALSIWGDFRRLWNSLPDNDSGVFNTNMLNNVAQVKEVIAKNCVLYFPHNRFEEPAWLNEDNLNFQVQLTDDNRYVNSTNRSIISYSPLRSNQNWFFGIAYDRGVFELQILPLLITQGIEGEPSFQYKSQPMYSGNATNVFQVADDIVRVITGRSDVQFGIGNRWNRRVSVVSTTEERIFPIVPNVFQMSSGETSLLNIFLSILRDYDMSEAVISRAEDIRGIVVVDEIDLHLHAKHQYEVLPTLIKMFPKVQFVVTTHSPLFVLGMHKTFGDNGFAIYRLPEGQPISPEEFSELGAAYQAITETQRFTADIRREIENAQKPIVFVEGKTDVQYITKATELLGKGELLASIELKEGGGSPNLDRRWKARQSISDVASDKKVLLLYDCDVSERNDASGNVFRRSIREQESHPIQKGIENLFSEETLNKAIQHKAAFIDIYPSREVMVRGVNKCEPERWEVNEDEKTNLCDWLCEKGTQEDFRGFEAVFKIIEDDLFPTSADEM